MDRPPRAASNVALPDQAGYREPLPTGQSDARRGARTRIRRIPDGNALPGAIQHSPVARPTSRRGARERRLLRRAGESTPGHRFDRACGKARDDRRNADRADARLFDQRQAGERVACRGRAGAACRTGAPGRAERNGHGERQHLSRQYRPRRPGLGQSQFAWGEPVGAPARVPLDVSRYAHRIGASRVGSLVHTARRHPRRGVARSGRRARAWREDERHDRVERSGRHHPDRSSRAFAK